MAALRPPSPEADRPASRADHGRAGRALALPRTVAEIRRHRQRRSSRPSYTCRRVSTFVFRLRAPRPNFALDMTDAERAIMERHAAHWQPFVDAGQMVVFGPVLDSTGSWGLAVIEHEDEEQLRLHAAGDPAVTSGTAEIELGSMLAGFVRPR